MPQGSPASGEQGEAAFAEAAQASQQGVVGASVGVEYLAVGGLFDRGEHADARAVVAVVGQRGQVQLGVGPVQGTEDVLAGRGQVVYRAGLDVTDPQREAVRCQQGLDVAAGFVCFAGVPPVDLLAFHAGGLFVEAVGGEDLAVEDDVGQAVLPGLPQCFVQVRGVLGEHGDDLVGIAVAGGSGDAVITCQRRANTVCQ